jgi:hypothetical protein
MSATLDKLKEEVKTLSPDELQQMRALVDSLLSPTDEAAEDEFERALVAEGILLSRSEHTGPAVPDRAFKPVPVTGQLVSELVVEERR